jgi:TetR/AcrR family transcriptional regulator, tetracycline repressor protein
VSLVPYRDTRRPRERRPLDRKQVVQAALALLDEVGLDALTMRTLAERLGVKAASLYRHVRDKQDLLALLADEISGEIAIAADGRPWREQLVDAAWRYRRGLLVHRDAARLLASTPPAGPKRLRSIESLLDLLLASGLSDADAARAGYHLNNFVTEFVADEVRLTIAAEAMGTSWASVLAEARAHFRALPVDEFPNLTRLADYLADDDADSLFQFGVDLWLRGLESLREGRGSIHRGDAESQEDEREAGR